MKVFKKKNIIQLFEHNLQNLAAPLQFMSINQSKSNLRKKCSFSPITKKIIYCCKKFDSTQKNVLKKYDLPTDFCKKCFKCLGSLFRIYLKENKLEAFYSKMSKIVMKNGTSPLYFMLQDAKIIPCNSNYKTSILSLQKRALPTKTEQTIKDRVISDYSLKKFLEYLYNTTDLHEVKIRKEVWLRNGVLFEEYLLHVNKKNVITKDTYPRLVTSKWRKKFKHKKPNRHLRCV